MFTHVLCLPLGYCSMVDMRTLTFLHHLMREHGCAIFKGLQEYAHQNGGMSLLHVEVHVAKYEVEDQENLSLYFLTTGQCHMDFLRMMMRLGAADESELLMYALCHLL